MAVAAQKSRLLVGDFHLSTYATSVSTPTNVDTFDTTTFTSEAREFGVGRNSSTLAVGGLYAPSVNTDVVAWESAGGQPVTVGLSGLAAGAEVWMANPIATGLTTAAAGNDAVKFDLTGQTDGRTDLGVSLLDLTNVAGAGFPYTGTVVDGGAASTTGGVAHLHVTSTDSALVTCVVTIEDSATGSGSWATVGTFTTLPSTTTTTERITIAGTIRRYTRVKVTADPSTTGTDLTMSVALART